MSTPSTSAPNVNCPVWVHASYFATEQGVYTYDSLNAGQKKLGIEGMGATLRTNAIMSLAGNDPTIKHICAIPNTAHSGLWNNDGTFNETRFTDLTKNSVTVNGTQLITQSIFNKFLAAAQGSGFSGIMVGPSLYPFVPPLTYAQVTGASVSDFFTHFSDQEYNGEKAFTVAKLREFYTNPRKVMLEVEAKNTKPLI